MHLCAWLGIFCLFFQNSVPKGVNDPGELTKMVDISTRRWKASCLSAPGFLVQVFKMQLVGSMCFLPSLASPVSQSRPECPWDHQNPGDSMVWEHSAQKADQCWLAAQDSSTYTQTHERCLQLNYDWEPAKPLEWSCGRHLCFLKDGTFKWEKGFQAHSEVVWHGRGR